VNEYYASIAREILNQRASYIRRDLKNNTIEDFTKLVSWWVEEEGYYGISDKLIPIMFDIWNGQF